jgi:hypothetical protein
MADGVTLMADSGRRPLGAEAGSPPAEEVRQVRPGPVCMSAGRTTLACSTMDGCAVLCRS